MDKPRIEKMLEIIRSEKTGKKNGGYRPGSGRKPKAIREATLTDKRDLFWKLLTPERLEAITVAFMKRALHRDENARWILEQVIGKATQRMELTGKEGGKLELTITKIQ